MQSVLYARISSDVHNELAEVAELAGVSMAKVVETIVAWRLGLPTGPAGNAITKAIIIRKAQRC